jgi:hypothetical protein
VYKSAIEVFSRYITAIYNDYLRRGVFPKRWKNAKLLPIVKPGKEKSDEVSKFRPISLLNTGGKVVEKLLINRISHHVIAYYVMNKKSACLHASKEHPDAAMDVKGLV